MPTLKRLFSEPLVLNQNYMRSVTGILKCSHCFFTLVSTISLFYACRTIYDPYLGTFTGFSGGDIETTCLLFYFSTFFFSMFMIATYYFSIVAATIMSKTCYEFVYDLLAALLLFIISLSLMIVVIHRNRADKFATLFPAEPGFVGKMLSSSCGLIVSCLYAIDAFFAYRSYAQS